MKKKLVRNLGALVAFAGVVVALSGCGKQEVAVEGSSNKTVEYTNYAEAVTSSEDVYYTPTDEELQWAYLMAAAQTHDEDPMVQTMATNVAINIAKTKDMSLVEVFNMSGQFSGLHEGVPCIREVKEDHTVVWIPVTEDMLTDNLKEAVNAAFEMDYTNGAIYYLDTELLKILPENAPPRPEEFIQEGNWIFFKDI